MSHNRRVGPMGAAAMARWLNGIIAAGSTTALTAPVSGRILARWMTGSTCAS